MCSGGNASRRSGGSEGSASAAKGMTVTAAADKLQLTEAARCRLELCEREGYGGSRLCRGRGSWWDNLHLRVALRRQLSSPLPMATEATAPAACWRCGTAPEAVVELPATVVGRAHALRTRAMPFRRAQSLMAGGGRRVPHLASTSRLASGD